MNVLPERNTFGIDHNSSALGSETNALDYSIPGGIGNAEATRSYSEEPECTDFPEDYSRHGLIESNINRFDSP